jgi:Methyltransferase domain
MDRWYPKKIIAADASQAEMLLANPARTPLVKSLDALFGARAKSSLRIGEFGIWHGGTSAQFASFLGGAGELHIFDFEDNVSTVKELLNRHGHFNVTAWGCTYKHLDSYNWSLRTILRDHPELRFDYVYLDGAHTWAVDALTFLLCDKLIDVGGYIEFDDYNWRLRGSSLDPSKIPAIAEQYTDEQIDDYQVRAIVDLLVKPDPRYQEVANNRLFQKIGCLNAVPR